MMQYDGYDYSVDASVMSEFQRIDGRAQWQYE